MITIVNLNPCLDWQYTVPSFKLGGTNRVSFTREDVGGKGINTAIVLKNLGETPQLVGFNFTNGGEKVTAKLDAHKIPYSFETIDGAVRVNIKLYDQTNGKMTELNQQGSHVPPLYIKNLEQQISSINGNFLVLSGNLISGLFSNFYAQLISLWNGKAFLDTSGEALKKAVDSPKPPYAIKPNIAELEEAFNVKLKSRRDISNFCTNHIIAKGVSLVCVSMGAHGAMLVTNDGSYFCPAPKVEAKGVHGAGDSMLAGLIHGLNCGASGKRLLHYGIAAATASVKLDGTNLCTRDGFEKIFNEILQKG